VDSDDAVVATGRVLQVNVSNGGVPKLPVDRAWVGTLGLTTDKHRENTVHGGPHRAVCVYGIEAIERLQSEGHPVEPGSVGENLTTSGIEWSLLPLGSRARVGATLELEVASATTPCRTQIRNFRDGRFSRISIALHPSDSRMYARVLQEGEVKPGDRIRILPPATDSRAIDELLLHRLDKAEMKSSLAAWQAAVDSGFDVRMVDDGDLSMSASNDIRGPAFNRAAGLARMPHLVNLATDFYDQNHCRGWLIAETEPWAGAQAGVTIDVFAAAPDEIPATDPPTGVTIRPIKPSEGLTVQAIHAQTGSVGVEDDQREPWAAVYARLATHPHRTVLLAELDGEPVGAASVHVAGKAGWLRGASVIRSARGRGIQRALISARVQLAAERGCDVVGAWADPDGASAHNLKRMGMRSIGVRRHYSYVPASTAAKSVVQC
jgi:MOSC domain-containing protein YiiM/GNAT superfamily N-acetyltransferase